MARKKSALTEKQSDFVDAKLTGASNYAAAIAAGSDPTSGAAMAASKRVQEEIAKARAEIQDLTTLKRLDVIDGIMRGIEMANFMADPGVVIKGWVEIAKILGHYAPEVKRIEITTSQGRLRTKYEALSDEMLLAIAEGAVIDAEFTTEEN
jgi:hypothetical protein